VPMGRMGAEGIIIFLVWAGVVEIDIFPSR
jgi:hypothetical protein